MGVGFLLGWVFGVSLVLFFGGGGLGRQVAFRGGLRVSSQVHRRWIPCGDDSKNSYQKNWPQKMSRVV